MDISRCFLGRWTLVLLAAAINYVPDCSCAVSGGGIYASTYHLPEVLQQDFESSKGWGCRRLPGKTEDRNHGYLRETPVITHGPRDVVLYDEGHGAVNWPCKFINAARSSRVDWYFKSSIGSAVWKKVDEEQSGWRSVSNNLTLDSTVRVTPEMQGFYRCQVTVKFVGAVTSQAAQLKLAYLVGVDSLELEKYESLLHGHSTSSETLYLQEGSDMLLPCAVVDGGVWSPTTKVWWTLDNRIIAGWPPGADQLLASEAHGYTVLDNGTLFAWNIDRSCGGVYQCHASPPKQTYTANSKSTRLIAVKNDAPTPKENAAIRLVASSTTPIVGDRVVLTCLLTNISDNNGGKINWSYGSTQQLRVETTEDTDCAKAESPVLLTSKMHNLVLCEVTVEMDGEYVCSAVDHGDDGQQVQRSSRAVISVQTPPHLRIATHVVDLPTIMPNQMIVLNCSQYLSSGSSDTVHVRWFFNGTMVKHGSGVHAWTYNANGTMPGIFQCTIQTPYGYVDVAIRLRVAGPPAQVIPEKKKGKRWVPFCSPLKWPTPVSYSSPITHYFIAERSRAFKSLYTTYRLDMRGRAPGHVTVEVCRQPSSRGECNVRLVACSKLGCGKPMCAYIKPPKEFRRTSPVGFSSMELEALNESTVNAIAVGITGKLICGATFHLHHPNGTFHAGTKKICGNSSDESDEYKPIKINHHFENLESCTEYLGCVAANLSDLHAGVDFTDIGTMYCDTKAMKGRWVSVKTMRSYAPKQDPVVLKTFRVGSDAVVLWKPSDWCGLVPHALFQWTSYRIIAQTHEKQSRFFFHANNSLGDPMQTQVYARTGLTSGVEYTVKSRSCNNIQPSNYVYPNKSMSVYTSFQCRGCTKGCSSGVVSEKFSVPANFSVHISREDDGIITVTSNWTLDKDLREHIMALHVHHSCNGVQNTTTAPQTADPSTETTAILPSESRLSVQFVYNASDRVACNVSLLANVSNFPKLLKMSTAVQVAVVMVINTTDESPADKILPEPGDPEDPDSPPHSESSTNILSIAISSVLIAITIAIATVLYRYVKHRRRQDRSGPGWESLQRRRPTRRGDGKIPTPPLPKNIDKAQVFVNEPVIPQVIKEEDDDDDDDQGFDYNGIGEYAMTTIQRVMHQLKMERLAKKAGVPLPLIPPIPPPRQDA